MTTTHRRVGPGRLLGTVTGLAALLLGFGAASAGAVDSAASTKATTNASPQAGSSEEYKVLVVGKTLGFRHSHIDETTHAVIDMGEQSGFTVDVWDPPNSSGGWWGPG